MSKNKLLLTISILSEEISERKNFIIQTIKNLNNSIIKTYHILIIIQIEKEQKIVDIDCLLDLANTEIIFSHIKSVSHARNLGIEYAVKNNFSHIIISDSMVIIDSSFFIDVDNSIKNNIDLMRGKIVWTNDFNTVLKPKHDSSKKELDIFNDSYVGSFLFQVKKLTNIRFNESVGPASYTIVKAGEDVLFLYTYIKKHGYTYTSVSGYICHPPRDKNFLKHLKYAKGQGALYRYFLFQDIKPRKYYLYLFLFWVNSFIRVVLLKKNSVNILFDRIYGFFIIKINN